MDKETDLTTLTGPNGKYAPLVKGCFTDEAYGNTTLIELKSFTLDSFLHNFGAGKPTIISKLKAWLDFYELKGEFEEDQKQGSREPRGEAYNVTFTILRDNRQADGLRKLITMAAAKNGAFYSSSDNAETTQKLHNAAFASETTPEDFDLSLWPPHKDGEACPRLLSVTLHFRSYDKIGNFEAELVELLEGRPSAVLVDKQAKTVLPDTGKVCNISKVALIEMPRHVLPTHYVTRQSTPLEAKSGEPLDSKDECDLTVSVPATLPQGLVGNFDENDRLYPYHAIEKRHAFALHAEKAHIFPHCECVKAKMKSGKKIKVETFLEWLDSPEEADFNFLYLSSDMHLSFDGSGHGNGVNPHTQACICIEPLARTVADGSGVKRYSVSVDRTTGVPGLRRAKIPIRLWCRSRDVFDNLKPRLVDGVQSGSALGLPFFDNIFLHCEERPIYMQPEPLLQGDSQERVFVYNKRVPFMDEKLSGAWSLTDEGYLSSSEIMEKCLLWSANRTWNTDWMDTVANRNFESLTA